MKILFVSHSVEWNGAEHFLYFLLEGIDRKKYEPLVALPGQGRLEEKIRKLGIKTRIVDLKWWCHPDFPDGLKPRVEALGGLIQREKINLVFTNTSVIAEGALAARLAGVPHVWSIHELVFSDPELWAFLKPPLFADVLRALSDKLVVNSLRTRREIEPYLKTKKLELIYPALPPLDNKIRTNNQREPGGDGCAPQVCFVGNIAHWKGVFSLAEAAPEILKRFPQTRFVLLGKDAGALGELKSVARKRQLGHAFRFLGFREDATEVIQDSDLLVLPSFAESFGLVLLEAMSLGKPTVATRCGGPEEIVLDGETGILVPVNDPPALANAIIHLLENPQKMRLMGQRGKERVERMFAYDHSIKKLENLFDETLVIEKTNPLVAKIIRIILDLLDGSVALRDNVILEQQIEKLTQSPEGRLAAKCRSLFEKLMPLHSKRRTAYQRAVQSLKVFRMV